jgi:ABC-2 type transport system permease protein
MVRASGAAVLRAPLKLAVIVSVWTTLLAGIYALAYQGLHFLYKTAGVGPFLLDRLWYLFLFITLIMLAVSQLASAYSTLVRSPETKWWITLPLSARTICRAKWIESSFYSAWAVFLLIGPLGIAYLAVLQRSFWLLGWMGLLLLPLIAIVTALSTSALLVWLRWCGRVALRREVIAVGFVAACGVLFWLLGEQHEEGEQDIWFLALQELLPRMQVAMSPWMPSSWVATSLGAGLNSRWIEGGLYGALLWMTALMAWRLVDHAGAVLLVPVVRKQGQRGDGKAPSVRSPIRVTMTWWMRHPFRASLAKDLWLVIRDPMQWSQAVVFFGLLGAYFANIHRVTRINLEPTWRIGIASLHLACTLLVFGSLAVRFLFPQMSLEGRSLWLLRIAPGGIRHLMLAKLALYGTIAVFIIEGLLGLSASRLGIPFAIRWWLSGVGVLAALTIVGLTVGLGAWWIDPSAQDAARVVSSSRGALVLVLMLGYVGCVVGSLVMAWSGWAHASPAQVLLTSGALVIVSVAAGWLPVRMGRTKLERLEHT